MGGFGQVGVNPAIRRQWSGTDLQTSGEDAVSAEDIEKIGCVKV